MAIKKVPINYASRDYESIKSDLVSLAKKYYPNSFKDFSEAGFGSMMIDMVAYIGDIMSFYVDYQANEAFFDSANEFKNVIKLARQMGYKFRENPSSQGIATFFISVPASANGLEPDKNYIPTLKYGTILSTNSGNAFTLIEDVFFSREDNDVVVGQVDENTGLPISYIIRAFGKIISGNTKEILVEVGSYKRFLKVTLGEQNIAEIINVEDIDGNKYYEVDYLSQDVVYRRVINRSDTNKYAPSLLKPFNVPRRFIVERDGTNVNLQFGTGYDSSGEIKEALVDPSKVLLKFHAKDFFTDEEFDPTNLVESDVFGIVPENTTLKITVRVNDSSSVNAGVDTVTKVVKPNFEFNDLVNINRAIANSVVNSLESTNDEPILGDITVPTVEDFKTRVMNSYATQNRAVTKQDYEAMCYKMPPIFGLLKRVKAIRDADSFKRNINIYCISEDSDGSLIQTNSAIKENLKVWINKNRMINDTIDILDTNIINFGIEFEIIIEPTLEKTIVFANAVREVKKEFATTRDIGEPLFITDVYKALKKEPGVLDVVSVNIVPKFGGLYSDYTINIQQSLSPDGRYVIIPENSIFEIKFPDLDIKGTIK
jgi:hypothetical protein